MTKPYGGRVCFPRYCDMPCRSKDRDHVHPTPDTQVPLSIWEMWVEGTVPKADEVGLLLQELSGEVTPVAPPRHLLDAVMEEQRRRLGYDV